MLALADTSATTERELEFRSYPDDAWYNVRLVRQGEKLIVQYCNFQDENDEVYETFESLEKFKDFESRFRPTSVQLQDNECKNLTDGQLVCASHTFTGHDDDVRFYDATVEHVYRNDHSFEKGEEECLCIFVLLWKHGPYAGVLSEKKVENICFVQSSMQLDPNLASFLKIARDKIKIESAPGSDAALAPKCGSGVAPANCRACHKENSSPNVKQKSTLVQRLKQGTNCRPVSEICSAEGRISGPCERSGQDTDVGGIGNHYIVLLENLEKDLSPSRIVKFIYQQISVKSRAFVFPSLSYEQCTRGAIVVDSQKDLKVIYGFLDYEEHFIISSSGRPWVVAKNMSINDVLRSSIGSLMLNSVKKLENNNGGYRMEEEEELKVVGSMNKEEYGRAKELKDLYMEFNCHQERLYKRLAIEEREILTATLGAWL